MKSSHRIRALFTGSALLAVSILLTLLAGTACQTKKGAKGANQTGANVKMAELRQVIQTRVPDPVRVAALMNTVDHAERELGAINEGFIKHIKEFGKMSANHSKDANDLHMNLTDWEIQASAQRRRLTDVLFSMRSNATPEEWPLITNAFLNSVKRQSDRYKSLH